MEETQLVGMSVIAMPLLFVPVLIGMLWLMLVLVFAKTKSKETLLLNGVLFVLFCISFQTFHAINEEKLLFLSKPYLIGTVVSLGAFMSMRLLLFTKLEWRSLLPDIGITLIGYFLLNLQEVVAGTILSLMLICYSGYRIWENIQYGSFTWTFANYSIYFLVGLFGFAGIWLPFDGVRFLYAFFLIGSLVTLQLQLFDFVMDRLKTASMTSITDPMTGLYNKGFLLKKAEQLAQTQEFSVIFADIDNFKELNDTKGHDHGDLILKDSSKLLQDILGENGYACRFGGEELVGIVTKGNAERKAEKFRSLVEKRLGVTVSVGVATGCDDGALVVKEADQAMYEAKNNGKNRVVIAGRPIISTDEDTMIGGGEDRPLNRNIETETGTQKD